MVLVLCSPDGDCLQVGGYDVDPGYPSAGAWPGGWNVSTAGIYTANISLSLVPLSGSGSWSLQVINGWTSSGIVDYDMDLQFPGLCPLATDVPGCTDAEACNYDADATVNDGSCEYTQPCPGDLNGDGTINVNDLLDFSRCATTMAPQTPMDFSSRSNSTSASSSICLTGISQNVSVT